MAGGSNKAVYTAIAANTLIAVAKFVGYFLSGSGAMLAEAIHSVADVGNQALLALGMSRAQRLPDARFPEGYRREAFVWALISAVGIFFLGCGATVFHGAQELWGGAHSSVEGHGEAVGISVAILLVSLLLEGWSGVVAIRVSIAHARQRGLSLVAHLRSSEDPFELAILLEDSAAMFGILIALAAIGLGELTGAWWWDPAGSITVGLLLGAVAVALVQLNRGLLIGRAVSVDEEARIRAAIERSPAVEGLERASAIVSGAERYAVRAGVDFRGAHLAGVVLRGKSLHAEADAIRDGDALRRWADAFAERLLDVLADEVDRIEANIRAVVPQAEQIDLEPERKGAGKDDRA